MDRAHKDLDTEICNQQMIFAQIVKSVSHFIRGKKSLAKSIYCIGSHYLSKSFPIFVNFSIVLKVNDYRRSVVLFIIPKKMADGRHIGI